MANKSASLIDVNSDSFPDVQRSVHRDSDVTLRSDTSPVGIVAAKVGFQPPIADTAGYLRVEKRRLSFRGELPPLRFSSWGRRLGRRPILHGNLRLCP